MVRPTAVGRSRACEPCRRKRIKCDLGVPACRRCLDARIECPGPLQGPIILISRKGEVPKEVLSQSPSYARRAAGTFTASTPANLYRKATSSVLLSTFVQYLAHSARRSSWTLSLPDLATDTQPGTLSSRSALNAVSLAHFSNTTSDEAFDNHAAKEYGRALTYHRQALFRIPATRPADLWAVLKQSLLTTTLLSYYELIAANNPVAWGSHTGAAEQLLSIMGTDAIREDVFVRQLAVSIRSHAILRASIYRQQTIFSSEPWLGASREWTKAQEQSIARDAYDWVTEWILRVSRYRNGHPIPDNETKGGGLEHARATFEVELEANYEDFLLGLEPPIFATSLPLFASTASRDTSKTSARSVPALPASLRKQFPSMAYAHFHAAALLHQQYFPRHALSCPQNGDWIISVGQYLEQDRNTNATAILRMGFPFAMSWHCASSDDSVRKLARDTFERWCQREGMTGLAVIIYR